MFEQLRKMLEKFDWSYEMSDDHSVWRRGKDAEEELLSFLKGCFKDDAINTRAILRCDTRMPLTFKMKVFSTLDAGWYNGQPL